MNGARIEGGDDGRLSIAGVLSFATVPEAWKRVRSLLKASTRVTVDLEGVTRADSAGLALLVECVREARRGRKEIEFVNMPEPMLVVARVSGLDRLFSCLEDGGAAARGPLPLRPGVDERKGSAPRGDP